MGVTAQHQLSNNTDGGIRGNVLLLICMGIPLETVTQSVVDLGTTHLVRYSVPEYSDKNRGLSWTSCGGVDCTKNGEL